jgi:hypothetical protein
LKSGLGDTDQFVEEAMSGTSSASPSDATSLEGSQDLLSETLQSSVVPIIEHEQASFSAARDLQFTVCPESVGIGECFPMELQIRSLKLSLPQTYSYLELIKGPQRKMRLISGNMDGVRVRVGVMRVPYLQKYVKQMEEGQLLIMKAELASLEGVQSFLEPGKQKMKTVADDLAVQKFCAGLNLKTGVYLEKGL